MTWSLSFQTNSIVEWPNHAPLEDKLHLSSNANICDIWNDIVSFLPPENCWDLYCVSLFGFSVLLSVALDSKCGPCNASPTLDRRLVTVQKLLGLRRCSSVKANVTVPPLPILKVSFPGRRSPRFPELEETHKTPVCIEHLWKLGMYCICNQKTWVFSWLFP